MTILGRWGAGEILGDHAGL